jgi:hypothetical protein
MGRRGWGRSTLSRSKEELWNVRQALKCIGSVEPTFRNGQRRRPLIPQNVKTDRTVGIDVRVVDASGEVDLGRLEGVVGGESDAQEEDTGRVWAVRLL